MDMDLKSKFEELWDRYFPGADLPITFYYSSSNGGAEVVTPPAGWRCFIGDLARVRRGQSLCFTSESVTCSGGQRYLGFSDSLRPNFRYFLSCGIPGQMEGERYKHTPELVDEAMRLNPPFKAPAKNIVFKRWDSLTPDDEPEVVIFYAHADILSGLFTLANFDRAAPDGVYAPFSAGCGSIVQYPVLERGKEQPRAVLGMFDVSARPCVEENRLSFAFPFDLFRKLIGMLEESFLITDSWDKVRRRIGHSAEKPL